MKSVNAQQRGFSAPFLVFDVDVIHSRRTEAPELVKRIPRGFKAQKSSTERIGTRTFIRGSQRIDSSVSASPIIYWLLPPNRRLISLPRVTCSGTHIPFR